MTSISQLGITLKTLLTEDAGRLAQQHGLRRRLLSGAVLAQLFVLGWLQQPTAGPSALARFAGTLGLRLKKQTLDAHFTQQTADWLLALLQQAVRYVVCAQAVSLPLLRRFRAVLVEDGSQITLPAALQERWPGCGGTATDHGDAKTKAGMKLTVRWDVLGGAMDGPYVQAGRAHESRSPLRERQMAPGSLWIADLGYFALQWLGQLSRQGVFFLLRYLDGTPIWRSGGKPIELLDVLPQTAGAELDLPIVLGARKLVQARLLAIRLPADAIKQRRERMQERARQKGKTISARAWELAQWTIMVTNVPVSKLSVQEALALLRARWQIELLFKLWKEQGYLDEWQGVKAERILCELFAKLIGLVIQHWLVLLSCWDDPHRSLPAVCEVIRGQVPTLVHALMGRLSWRTALRLIKASVAGGCSIPARASRPSTSRILEMGVGWALT